MKLKLDENGGPELKDSQSVHMHDDGKELAGAVPALFSKTSALNEEARSRRLAATCAPAFAEPAAALHILGLTKGALEITVTREDVPEGLKCVASYDNVNHPCQGQFGFSVGVKGLKWNVFSGGTKSTNAALATGTNWDKSLPGVCSKVAVKG